MSITRSIMNWLRPAPPAKRANAFDSAGSGRRARGWVSSTEGINSLMFANAETLRNRSRDANRKNPWAANAKASYRANAIGTGIKPRSLFPEAEVRKVIHREFRRYTDQADFYGRTDLYGLQAVSFDAMFEAGEVLIRKHIVTHDAAGRRLRVPLQFQVLEADHLPLNTWTRPKNVAEGNEVRSGVEVDPQGRPVAYHIYPEHPGETVFWGRSQELVRVPASEMIHMFRSERPGQLRGQPWLTQVLVTLYELDQYTDAALLRRKFSAMITGFVKKTDVATEILSEEVKNPDNPSIAEAEIEAGTMYNLAPGEEIQWSETPEDKDFSAFCRWALLAIAAGIGITVEQLTGDLSGVNYSSIRAGLLEFRRKCEQMQHSVIVYQMCRPIYLAWMEMAVLSGALDLPNFNARRADYEDHYHRPPGWPWVDPESDVKGKILEIRAGLTSRARTAADAGEDVEEIDDENKADQERSDRLGLVYSTDGRAPEGESLAGESRRMKERSAPPQQQSKSALKGFLQ